MLSNVLKAKAISGALLSSYLTQCIKNTNSVATTPLQFRNGMYNFVTELSHILCDVFVKYTFWHNKYELSLTIDIRLLHMYHLSVLPPKQHKMSLIVSRQISIVLITIRGPIQEAASIHMQTVHIIHVKSVHQHSFYANGVGSSSLPSLYRARTASSCIQLNAS